MLNLAKSQTFDPNFDDSQQPVIQIKNLCHYYGTGNLRKQILFDINLTIQPGEIVLMTGPSGSGKTTLLTLMGCLRSVQEGHVRILGQEIHGASKGEMVKIRSYIGYIFQAHNLLGSLTALQNVQMSIDLHEHISNREAIAKSIQMLAQVGLAERTDYFPATLSGGKNNGWRSPAPSSAIQN